MTDSSVWKIRQVLELLERTHRAVEDGAGNPIGWAVTSTSTHAEQSLLCYRPRMHRLAGSPVVLAGLRVAACKGRISDDQHNRGETRSW